MNKEQFNQRPQSTPSSLKPDASKEGIMHKAGDAIERLGEKVARNGAEKIGKVIHDAGDKIEHLGEK